MHTQARWGGSSRTGDRPTRQMTELANAFRAFSGSVPDLTLEVVGHVAGSRQLVHPVAGFHVRLEGADGTGVSLYISSGYAELVRWRPGVGALRERFEVSLEDQGFGWNDTFFPTAQELAHDLVAYMQFNLDALRKS
jgi:hypothetical protein